MTGWKPDGARPEPNHYVLIAAPHTSNWDFPYLIAFAWLYRIQISWMGKDRLFRRPFGTLMRALGGIAVRRDQRENLVMAMARAFDDYEEMALVVPAEGTRSRVEHWKSGFYHIATTAGVPIVMSYLDYTRKVGGFGPVLHPTGDARDDMEAIRTFYSNKQGKYPQLFGRPQLLEEEVEPDPTSGIKPTV